MAEITMKPITRQQTRYMTRAEFDALDKTTVSVGTEICIVDQIQKEDLSTDLQNAITKAEDSLSATGGTVSGDLTVSGNLTVNGTTTTIESTTLKVKDKLIEVASDNTVALTTPAGMVAPKYDGTNSGALVFDYTGTAYVGDVTLNADGNIDVGSSELQPLATRNLSSDDDGKLVQWDETNKTLVASTKSFDDVSSATNLQNGTGTNTLQQAPAQSTFINTIVGYTKNDSEGSTAGVDAYGAYVDPVIYNATDNTTTVVNSGENTVMLGGLSHSAHGVPTAVRPDYTGDATQSFIFGRRNINIGDYNAVFNTDNIIYGDNCFVSGLRNVSLANETTMLGTGLVSNHLRQIVLGYCNEPDDTSRFMIGGGWMTQHKDGTNPDGSNKYVLDSITRRTIFKVSETGDTYAYGKMSARLTPTDDIDVVRLQELNNKSTELSTQFDNKLNGKLDKLTPKTSSLLYGLTPEGNNIGFSTGTATVSQYAIPQRGTNGHIAMPNQITYAPTDDQAISKRFADNTYVLKGESPSGSSASWHDTAPSDTSKVLMTEITINPASTDEAYIFHDSKCIVAGYQVNAIRGTFPLSYLTEESRYWYGSFTGTVSASGSTSTLVGASTISLAGVVNAATAQSGDTAGTTTYAYDGGDYNDASVTFRFLY